MNEFRVPVVGDTLEITQDGNQVCITISGACIAETVSGFGDTVSKALLALVDDIEKQGRNGDSPK